MTFVLEYHELISADPGIVRDDVHNQVIYIRGNMMVLEIREHLHYRGNDPLQVTVAGTRHKAYLVANLALQDGAQAAADHYGIDLANVYGTMAFYYDNEVAINKAIRQARELDEQLGARSAQSALQEMKERNNAP